MPTMPLLAPVLELELAPVLVLGIPSSIFIRKIQRHRRVEMHTTSAEPAWGVPYWGTIDAAGVSRNVRLSLPRGGALDLRYPLLSRIFPALAESFRRLEISLVLVSSAIPDWRQAWQSLGGTLVLIPPYSPLPLREGLCGGVSFVVDHVSHAILLSNEAQACNLDADVLVRVRSGDLLVDGGPTGTLAILELLPRLPMLNMRGLFLDIGLHMRAEADALQRAVDRLFPEQRGLQFIFPGQGRGLPRMEHVPFHGTAILGLDLSSDQGNECPFSLYSYACPVRAIGGNVLMMLDLGVHHGIHPQETGTIMVGGVPAVVKEVHERNMIVEATCRPDQPSPWVATLFGDWDVSRPDSKPLRRESLMFLLSGLASETPLWVTDGNNRREILVSEDMQ